MSVINNIDLTDQVSTTGVNELNENFNNLNDDKLEKVETYDEALELTDEDYVLIYRPSTGETLKVTATQLKDYTTSPIEPGDIILTQVQYTGDNQASCLTHNNNEVDISTPVLDTSIGNIKGFHCGSLTNTYYIMEDGSVQSVGRNSYIGRGTVDNRVLVQVPNLSNIKKIVGGSNNMFLKEDGSVYGCGPNSGSLLGIPDINIIEPILIGTEVKDIAIGVDSSLILKEDGTVYGCGKNLLGELGFGDTTSRSIFTLIPSLSNIKSIYMGGRSSFFVKEDGTVLSCGQNTYGQLGVGDEVNRNVPTAVIGVDSPTKISISNHVLFLFEDKTGKGVGRNAYSQLGDGTIINKSTPITLSEGNIIDLAICSNESILLLSTGVVRGVGRNNGGELGVGDLLPVTTWTDMIGITAGKKLGIDYGSSVIVGG